MDALRALTGWILFLIMAVIAAFFWQQSDARGRRIDELTGRITEIDAQIVSLGRDIAALQKALTQAESLFEELHLLEIDLPEAGLPHMPEPDPAP